MKRRAGFTLIEVMMALACLTLGAAALIGTQTMTMRSNSQARQMTIATDIAQTWAERLKLDAVSWNNVTQFAGTTWLVNQGGGMNQWMVPGTTQINGAPLPNRSYVFDSFGRDVPLGTPFMFCMVYRFNWVVPPNALQPNAAQSMRVDIRVFWPRENTQTNASCASDPLNGPNPALYRTVSLPVVVKQMVLNP